MLKKIQNLVWWIGMQALKPYKVFCIMEKLNGYELSRRWFDFCFDNPDLIKPNHSAVFFFAIEHCNRLGWKDKFGFPSQMVMEAVGIKNWRTYSSALNDLVKWQFIEMIETSKNQYSSNIIAIVKNTKAPTKAHTKALDKALQKHSTKQGQSIVSIDKQETSNKEQINKEQEFKNSLHPFLDKYGKDMLNDFFLYWTEKSPNGRKMRYEKEKVFDPSRRLATWSKRNFGKEKSSGKKEKSGFEDRLSQAERILNHYKNQEQ